MSEALARGTVCRLTAGEAVSSVPFEHFIAKGRPWVKEGDGPEPAALLRKSRDEGGQISYRQENGALLTLMLGREAGIMLLDPLEGSTHLAFGDEGVDAIEVPVLWKSQPVPARFHFPRHLIMAYFISVIGEDYPNLRWIVPDLSR